MELTDLQEAIAEAADDLAMVAPSVGGKGKAYEVWILFELAVRLMKANYAVTALDPADIAVGLFRVRGSPGGMPSADAQGDDNPSHLLVEGEGVDLEIHVGLQVVGVSDSTHEIDITILPSVVGRWVRYEGGGPYRGPLAVGLELKAYDGKHKLNQGFPRALLGVAVDVDPSWLFPERVLVTAGGAEQRSRTVRRTLFGLATSTTLYDNSRRLLDHHGMLAADGATPTQTGELFDQIIEGMVAFLGPAPGAPTAADPPGVTI